jgi:hypothetical protein
MWPGTPYDRLGLEFSCPPKSVLVSTRLQIEELVKKAEKVVTSDKRKVPGEKYILGKLKGK